MNLEKVRAILPNRIRFFRASRHLTQEQLAERADIHATYVSRIESAGKLPTLVIICRIADALDVEVCELLMDEVKFASFDYQKKKLINIVRESRPVDLDIYSTLLDAWHSRHNKKYRREH